MLAHLEGQPRQVAWVSLVVMSVLCTGWSVVSLAQRPPDGTRALLDTYGSVSAYLQSSERVGFIQPSGNPTEAARHFFVAQHALAPRILVQELDGIDVAISAIGGPSSFPGFSLVAVSESGVRVFRRTHQP